MKFNTLTTTLSGPVSLLSSSSGLLQFLPRFLSIKKPSLLSISLILSCSLLSKSFLDFRRFWHWLHKYMCGLLSFLIRDIGGELHCVQSLSLKFPAHHCNALHKVVFVYSSLYQNRYRVANVIKTYFKLLRIIPVLELVVESPHSPQSFCVAEEEAIHSSSKVETLNIMCFQFNTTENG